MHKIGTETTATVGVASAAFIGQNPRRRGLLISVPSGDRISISKADPAVLGAGVTLQNLVAPFYL